MDQCLRTNNKKLLEHLIQSDEPQPPSNWAFITKYLYLNTFIENCQEKQISYIRLPNSAYAVFIGVKNFTPYVGHSDCNNCLATVQLYRSQKPFYLFIDDKKLIIKNDVGINLNVRPGLDNQLSHFHTPIASRPSIGLIPLKGSDDIQPIELRQCAGCTFYVSTDFYSAIDKSCFICSQKLERTCVVCCNPDAQENLYGYAYYHAECVDVNNKNLPLCVLCNRKSINKNEIICKKCEPIVIHDYNYKPPPVFLIGKNESQKEGNIPYMGIELEAEIKPHLRKVQFKKDIGYRFKTEVNKALGFDFVYLKRDSSIGVNISNDRGDCAFEIVTHPASFEAWHSEEAKTFFNEVAKLTKTMSSYNSGNCGIHVHISRNAFTGPAHLAKFGWFIENRLYYTSVVSERSSLEYAKIGMNPWTSVMKSGYKSKDHHSMINYTDYTVEVRPFRGNLKQDRILKDIQFVYAVWEWTKNIKCSFEEFKDVLTVNKFEEFINRNPKQYQLLIEYINSHINPIFIIEAKGPSEVPQQDKYEKLFSAWVYVKYHRFPHEYSFESLVECFYDFQKWNDTAGAYTRDEIISVFDWINSYPKINYIPEERFEFYDASGDFNYLNFFVIEKSNDFTDEEIELSFTSDDTLDDNFTEPVGIPPVPEEFLEQINNLTITTNINWQSLNTPILQPTDGTN